MNEFIQYLIIFALFIVALYVIFKPFFQRKTKHKDAGKDAVAVSSSRREKKQSDTFSTISDL